MPNTTIATNRPQQISGPYSNAYLVKNDGNDTIWLGQDSSLSPTSYSVLLAPGSSMNWSGTTELWAIAASSGQTLAWFYDGTGAFTPGPSVVTAITSNRIGTIIPKTTYLIPASSNNTVFSHADSSAYSALLFRVGDSVTNNANATRDSIRFAINWYDSDGVYVTSDEFTESLTGIVEYTIEVKGDSFDVQTTNAFAATSLPISVRGTTLALPERYYHQPGAQNQVVGAVSTYQYFSPLAGIDAMLATKPVAGIAQIFLPTLSGDTEIGQLYVKGGPAQHTITLYASINTNKILSYVQAVNVDLRLTVTNRFIMPNTPLVMFVDTGTDTNIDFDFSIQFS